MKKLISLLAASLIVCIGFAQKKKDIESIKEMCGCYEVSFNFAETFSPDKDYEFHDNYRSGALEFVIPIVETKDKIVLQHLLIAMDTMIIKHWRQDWIYENTDLYVYDKDYTWKYQNLPAAKVKGTWTQKVYQVDDSPRYEGAATWVHVDGKNYWENTTDAPLPRRDATKRKDYNVMKRKNRQEITDYGWVHEQDNEKLVRDDSGDKLLVKEKGWNTYTKVDDSKCQVANDWWAKNQVYWQSVREVWDELYDTHQTLAFEKRVDDKFLFERLFELGDSEGANDPSKSAEVKEKIKEAITIHLKGDAKFASVK